MESLSLFYFRYIHVSVFHPHFSDRALGFTGFRYVVCTHYYAHRQTFVFKAVPTLEGSLTTSFAAVINAMDSSREFFPSFNALADNLNASPIPWLVMAKRFPQNIVCYSFCIEGDRSFLPISAISLIRLYLQIRSSLYPN